VLPIFTHSLVILVIHVNFHYSLRCTSNRRQVCGIPLPVCKAFQCYLKLLSLSRFSFHSTCMIAFKSNELVSPTCPNRPKTDTEQADAIFAAKHHCLPAPQLKFNWPLGLDLIWSAFEHQRANTVLQFFVDILDRTGPTFEQTLLGLTGFGTVEPRNIEAVLATQFSSRCAFHMKIPSKC
jgi:hypothetical protein